MCGETTHASLEEERGGEEGRGGGGRRRFLLLSAFDIWRETSPDIRLAWSPSCQLGSSFLCSSSPKMRILRSYWPKPIRTTLAQLATDNHPVIQLKFLSSLKENPVQLWILIFFFFFKKKRRNSPEMWIALLPGAVETLFLFLFFDVL